MPILIPVLGVIVALAAAARSTWSPCGLSMLSTITPFGERIRGHRYAVTVAWFVLGATLGGATLGALAAGLAAAVAGAGLGAHPAWVASMVALAAGVAAAADAGIFGDVIPLWRRQVDDGWLVRYRNWVYGAGFGWQIGVGLATYIMTAAVLLVVVLAGMSADPLMAAGICTLFGFVRGLAVLMTAPADSPARLRTLHRRFDRAGPVVRRAVIIVQLGVAVAVLAAQWPVAATTAGLVTLGLATAVAAVVVASKAAGRVAGRAAGRVAGRAAGRVAGRAAGRVAGRAAGRVAGRAAGRVWAR